jgi:hypothetical protein
MNNNQKYKRVVVFKGNEFDVLSDIILSGKQIDKNDFKNNVFYTIPYNEIVKLRNKLDEGKKVNVISEIKKYKRTI